jgi:hypothetical protein
VAGGGDRRSTSSDGDLERHERAIVAGRGLIGRGREWFRRRRSSSSSPEIMLELLHPSSATAPPAPPPIPALRPALRPAAQPARPGPEPDQQPARHPVTDARTVERGHGPRADARGAELPSDLGPAFGVELEARLLGPFDVRYRGEEMGPDSPPLQVARRCRSGRGTSIRSAPQRPEPPSRNPASAAVVARDVTSPACPDRP